jgi:hypothetical protein
VSWPDANSTLRYFSIQGHVRVQAVLHRKVMFIVAPPHFDIKLPDVQPSMESPISRVTLSPYVRGSEYLTDSFRICGIKLAVGGVSLKLKPLDRTCMTSTLHVVSYEKGCPTKRAHIVFGQPNMHVIITCLLTVCYRLTLILVNCMQRLSMMGSVT